MRPIGYHSGAMRQASNDQLNALLHDAVKTGAHLPEGNTSAPPVNHREFADGDDIEASRAGGAGVAIGPSQIQGFGGYAQNPLEEQGRERIQQQFMQAPLGGYVRDALDGQEIFGHKINNQQARMAEQGLAGLTVVGVGVPTFLAAVNQLSTPPDQGAIPL